MKISVSNLGIKLCTIVAEQLNIHCPHASIKYGRPTVKSSISSIYIDIVDNELLVIRFRKPDSLNNERIRHFLRLEFNISDPDLLSKINYNVASKLAALEDVLISFNK